MYIKLDYRGSATNSVKDYRPFFKLSSNNNLVNTLYDTGAEDSIWCRSINSFKRTFPNAIRLVGCYSYLYGIGNTDSIKYPVYLIPSFKLGNIEIINLPIVVRPSNLTPDLILQASIFRTTQVGIDFTKSTLYIKDVPSIRVRRVLNHDKRFLGSIVFTEENESLYEECLYIDDIPEDFISYADSLGLTIDELASKVYSCMPTVYKNESLGILENAILGWEDYKKFI